MPQYEVLGQTRLICGGGWHDPTQASLDYLTPTITALASSCGTDSLPIAAFASISYRLGPHPDNIHDVQAALAFLQRKFGFGSRYIFVGCNCGATLAFQSVMGRFRSRESEWTYASPAAIVGVAGVYDLKMLRASRKDDPACQSFVERAFGSDEAVWDDVSPATVEGLDGVEGGWDAGHYALLADPRTAGPIELAQRDTMKDGALARWLRAGGSGDRRIGRLPLDGEGGNGGELARAITFALERLQMVITHISEMKQLSSQAE
ncbi:hypothetical protein HFD88_006733 [Aspergillus terreus]|nr:hypothetical protein HFD88_006733 [Aspergillus terreus]